jgi:leader peptidase (prepilin peptidase) / N-methyltransferase
VFLTLSVVAFAVFGAIFGLAADRLSVRWPEHEEGYRRRGLDWRSAVVVTVGAIFFGGLAVRWGSDPRSLLILGLIGATLLVLLATDLDQKLLPDLITLPLIAVTAALLALGGSPLLAGKELGLASGVAAALIAPAFLFITDRILRGELGEGDLKLAVSIGLLCGISLLIRSLLVASIGFSAVLVVLIVLRRISLRTPVPFGPVLILAAFVAVLIG